jgi:non-heme chloroperoxidase
MQRRTLLKSASSAAAATLGLLALDPEGIMATPQRKEVSEKSDTRIGKPYIKTREGLQLFYRDWGTGRPVVFVHSWAVHSGLWQYQMAHLASQGFRCVAYDQRGHGRSDDAASGFDSNTLADDLATVIETLDLHDVNIVAHSMGCGTVVRYLTRHSAARVSRMAFLSPAIPCLKKGPSNPDGIDPSFFEQAYAAWSKDLPGWLAANARPFLVPETSDAMLAWVMQLCLQSSLKAVLECGRTNFEADFRSELPAVRIPALVLHGNADASAPVDLTGRKTAELLPNAKFILYDKGPHGLMFTHTDRVNADLAAFLRS